MAKVNKLRQSGVDIGYEGGVTAGGVRRGIERDQLRLVAYREAANDDEELAEVRVGDAVQVRPRPEFD